MAQAREKMFVAESTPLPWAPPVTQLNEFIIVLSNLNFSTRPSFNALELSAASRGIIEAAFARILLTAVRADAHTCINGVAAILAIHFLYTTACHLLPRRCSHASKLIIYFFT